MNIILEREEIIRHMDMWIDFILSSLGTSFCASMVIYWEIIETSGAG